MNFLREGERIPRIESKSEKREERERSLVKMKRREMIEWNEMERKEKEECRKRSMVVGWCLFTFFSSQLPTSMDHILACFEQ